MEKLLLSFARRARLIKLVISVIPTYAMQTTYLSSLVIDEIKKHVRDFLWGYTLRNRDLNILVGMKSYNLKTRMGWALEDRRKIIQQC